MTKVFKITALIFILFPFCVSAQDENYSETELLVLDFLTISEKFATSGAEASMHQSSAGWYLSAKKRSLWEVDVSLHANVLFLPKKKKTTTISNSDFNILKIRGGEGTAVIPTAIGGDTEVYFEGQVLGSDIEFQSLEGINKKEIVYPFLQASVAVPYGTNITLRVLPLAEVNNVEFQIYGAALQHNLNQHFERTNLSDIQFSALLAYSKIGVFYPFAPVKLGSIAVLDKIKINGDLYEFQFIVSKEINHFEFFSALGFSKQAYNYSIGGEGASFLSALNNAYERLNASESMIKGDIGFNFNYKNFSINNMLSVGAFLNYNVGVHYRI